MTSKEIDKTSQTEPAAQDHANWFVENVVHPFANGLAVEPWNAVASLTDAVTGHDSLPKCELLSESSAKTLSISGFAQGLSGGLGSLVPFLAAGNLTGHGLEGSGRLLDRAGLLDGSGLVAKGLANESTGMILGAGLYGGAMEPQKGQTRLGDAVGSAVGFGAFSLGNRFNSSLSARAITGLIGGSSQMVSSELISQGRTGSISSIFDQGISGGVMNALLPLAQKPISNAVDTVNTKLGRSIPVQNFINRSGWSDNPELTSLAKDTPLTRVKQTDTSTSLINQKSNVVELSSNLSSPEDEGALGHELSHRISANQSKSQMKEAASELPSDPEAATQKFLDLRTKSEQAAQEAGSRVSQASPRAEKAEVGNTAHEKPVAIKDQLASNGLTYGELFKGEAAEFVKSGGKYRPTTDFHGDGPGSTGSAFESNTEGLNEDGSWVKRFLNPETGLNTWLYEKPIESAQGLLHDVYERSPDGSYQRYSLVDANKNSLGTVETYTSPVATAYGTVDKIETTAAGASSYHVVSGDSELGIPDNSVVSPHKNPIDTQYGPVQLTIAHDGQIDYHKVDGTIAHEYDPPRQNKRYGEITSENNLSDGRTVYRLTDGRTAEWYPESIHVTVTTPDGSIKSLAPNEAIREASWTRYNFIDDQGDEKGSFEYMPEGDHLVMAETDAANNVTRSIAASVTEENPIGPDNGQGSPFTSMVRQNESIGSLYERADGSRTQIVDPGYHLDTDYGQAVRGDLDTNGVYTYTMDDGRTVLTRPDGMNSRYGEIKALEVLADGTKNYIRQDGTIIQEYAKPISTPMGDIGARENTDDKVTLYRPAPAEDGSMILEYERQTGQVTSFDDAGTVIPLAQFHPSIIESVFS